MSEKQLAHIREEKIKKLEELRKAGTDPFSHKKYPINSKINEVIEKFSKLKKDEKKEKEKIAVAGRIRAIRRHGKGGFVDIEDSTGKIQLWLSLDSIGKKNYSVFEKTDAGDIAGVTGSVFKTKQGELTILAKDFTLLTKALRPLPSTWFGLKDVETRYRQRYVDLVMNPDVKKTFEIRSKFIQTIRNIFIKKGYLEVETPILQPIYGGAFARPFETHHNSLDMKMYMRISNEMYLKRLIVGGLEKVFEFSPDFRNEGIDTSHNPEFLLLEAMTAYEDYKDGMKLVEELVSAAVKESTGKTKVTYQGKEIEFKPPWKKITMVGAIKEYMKLDVEKASQKELENVLKKKGIEVREDSKKGELIAVIFEEFVEEHLIQPTIVYDHPVETSALAKATEDNPAYTERFEFFIAGREAGNNYTEINDALELRRRFEEELKREAAGDDEAHPMDEDFLRAVEYGMPPTCGIGIGIDRIVMIITDSASIRDVILFPALRLTKEELHGDEDKDRIIKKK